MFTGIVEELGTVRALEAGAPPVEASRLVVEAGLATHLAIGGSIAVNGCCLTVVERGPGWWAADVVTETLMRTALGELAPGDRVNLERPVRPLDRLAGHLVQGHVDAVGQVTRPAPDLEITVPAPFRRYVVPKGSIALDGVSLTVAVVGEDGVGVAVIPHTAAVTTLGGRRAGERVNIEVDVLAKYVERLLGAGEGAGRAGQDAGVQVRA